MNRIIRIFSTLTALTLLAGSCLVPGFSAKAEDPAPKIRIGIIAPLTGPLADAGETVRNSALLAHEMFDKENRIEIVVDDDNFNPLKSVAIAKKMIDIDKVSAIIIFGSGTALSIADIAEKAHVPMFAIALSDNVTENRAYVFRYFLTAASIATAIQSELERRGYPAIALITSQQEGMISIRDAFLALKHPPIVLQEEILPNETDFKTLALKIVNAKAPVVVAPTFGFQLAIMAKQLRANKFAGDLASGPTLQIPSVVQSSDGALEGAWIATADDVLAAPYFARYQDTFHLVPVPDGMYAYDAARLLIEGALKGDILRYLNSTKKFMGIFGESDLGPNHTYTIATTIKVLKGDKFQKIR